MIGKIILRILLILDILLQTKTEAPDETATVQVTLLLFPVGSQRRAAPTFLLCHCYH